VALERGADLDPGAVEQRLVQQDPDDPGAQRRALLEAVDAPKDRQPGLLDDLLRDGRLGTWARASLSRAGPQRSTRSPKAASSPRRSAATS
jgi:hypothetical protein